MSLCYTVCTNSHLGKAKAMADSLIRHNPSYQVVIGLVDKITPQIKISDFSPHTLIEVEEINIPDFESLTEKYNIFELSCVAKPYFAQYLFARYPTLLQLFYFDSDIYFFNNLSSVEQLLVKHDIAISVHFTHNLEGNGYPNLRSFLNAGLYNTGFLALKRSDETHHFLNWWGERLWHEGYHNFAEGMFVDQLWLNFAPLFFKNVLLDTHIGHNVGYWNFHERTLQQQGAAYTVNETHPLVFFHFSGYDHTSPRAISVHQNLYSFKSRPDIAPVFEEYHQALMASKHPYYDSLPNAFYRPRYFFQKIRGVRKRLIILLRSILRILEN